jgi:EpsI family protein
MKVQPLVPINLAGTIVLLSATLMASKLASERKPEPLARPLETISRTLAGFTASDNPPLDIHSLHALGATRYLNRTYSRPGSAADLFIAYYAEQRAGESMHSPKHCLPGSGWEIWKYGRAEIPVQNGMVEINQYSISRESERRVVLYWYQSKTRVIASEYLGKLLLARDTLLKHGTSAAIVRIVVPDRTGALTEGRSLAAAIIPQLQHCFE